MECTLLSCNDKGSVWGDKIQHRVTAHLLHRFDIGREIAICFQVPLQSRCMTAGTETCCPTWVSPPPQQRLLFFPSSAGKKGLQSSSNQMQCYLSRFLSSLSMYEHMQSRVSYSKWCPMFLLCSCIRFGGLSFNGLSGAAQRFLLVCMTKTGREWTHQV